MIFEVWPISTTTKITKFNFRYKHSCDSLNVVIFFLKNDFFQKSKNSWKTIAALGAEGEHLEPKFYFVLQRHCFRNCIGVISSSLITLLFLGRIFFTLRGKHLLNSLIMLEYLVIIAFLMCTMFVSGTANSYVCLFVLFVLSVSSAALGLSLMICLCRSHGKDFLSAYNVLW